MAEYVGGDTRMISAGGRALARAAAAVADIGPSVGSAGAASASAAGDPVAQAALTRCGVAWSRVLDDLGTQVEAVGRLAETTATDLDVAGGS